MDVASLPWDAAQVAISARYLPLILIFGYLFYCTVIVLHRLFFSPIAAIPGPKLAAATQWYETYYEIFYNGGGQFTKHIRNLHEKYGPIVRINPWEVHIDDPEFYETIYGSQSNTDKMKVFEARFNIPKAAFSTADHVAHKHRRGAITPFFTKSRMQQHAPFVQSLVDKICSRFSQEYADRNKPVNFNDVFSCLSGDVITVLAFDKEYNLCSSQDWQTPFTKGMTSLVSSTHLTTQFPLMVPLMNMIPDSVMLKNEQMGPVVDFRLQMNARIHELFTSPADKEKGMGSKHTVFESILSSKLPASELTEERLQHEAVSLIGAAFDTTRQTLAKTCFHIINTPGVYETLHRELATAIPDPANMPSWQQLQQLPYLTACIEEGLRIGFGTVQRSPRINPTAPLVFTTPDGARTYEIPPNTPVSADSYHMHLNPAIFPSPTSYVPSRWLNNPVIEIRSAATGETCTKQLSRYMVAFGRGSRMCLGMQMAYSELYLTIASLMRRFRFELYETDQRDVEFVKDYVTPHPADESKGVRVLVFENP